MIVSLSSIRHDMMSEDSYMIFEIAGVSVVIGALSTAAWKSHKEKVAEDKRHDFQCRNNRIMSQSTRYMQRCGKMEGDK